MGCILLKVGPTQHTVRFIRHRVIQTSQRQGASPILHNKPAILLSNQAILLNKQATLHNKQATQLL